MKGWILQFIEFLTKLIKKTDPEQITFSTRADLIDASMNKDHSMIIHTSKSKVLVKEPSGNFKPPLNLSTIDECKQAFLAEHKKLLNWQGFFNQTTLSSDYSFRQLLLDAQKNSNGIYMTALINLGWWDQKTGKLSKFAPKPVRDLLAKDEMTQSGSPSPKS